MSEMENWAKVKRTFDAPIGLVWKMWTDPVLFRQWYGPMGFTVPVAEMDVRVGGTRKVCMAMKTPEREMSMWFTGVYREVIEPTRLRYTEAMCDAEGNQLSPAEMGMPEGTPDITEVIVDLVDQDGQTHVTMVHVGVPAGSPGEGGWSQAFDKLAEKLAAA